MESPETRNESMPMEGWGSSPLSAKYFAFGASICLKDSDLNAPKLQRLLGMSRSDLHRKLKAATGMSATAYIRYLRVRKAAQLLLEQPDACILGIALEVGFNNHSYFTKRFREVFGVCPGEYRERKGNLGYML